MLFSKCLRAKIYCNMNGHFDPQGCQTLLLKESELFFLSLGSWTSSESDDNGNSNVILGCLPDEVLASLDKSVVDEIKRIKLSISNTTLENDKHYVTVEGLAEFLEAAEINNTESHEIPSTHVPESGRNAENNIGVDCAKYVLNDDDYSGMLRNLSECEPDKHWKDITLSDFKANFQTIDTLNRTFNKKEIQICIRCISAKLKEKKIKHGLSCPKYKIIQLLHTLQTGVRPFEKAKELRG